jgi:hypothetical protein
MLGQVPVEVLQVLDIAAYLLLRVKPLLHADASHLYQPVFEVNQLKAAPLLVLHHHARRATAWVLAHKHHIGPLRGQRQPVLNQHLDMAEAGFAQLGQQRRDTALPAPHLGP